MRRLTERQRAVVAWAVFLARPVDATDLAVARIVDRDGRVVRYAEPGAALRRLARRGLLRRVGVRGSGRFVVVRVGERAKVSPMGLGSEG